MRSSVQYQLPGGRRVEPSRSQVLERVWSDIQTVDIWSVFMMADDSFFTYKVDLSSLRELLLCVLTSRPIYTNDISSGEVTYPEVV